MVAIHAYLAGTTSRFFAQRDVFIKTPRVSKWSPARLEDHIARHKSDLTALSLQKKPVEAWHPACRAGSGPPANRRGSRSRRIEMAAPT